MNCKGITIVDLVSTATRYVACDAYHLQGYLMPNMISI